MPQNLSAQFVCPSPKVLDFNEERLHWASVVRALDMSKVEDYGNSQYWLSSFQKKDIKFG